MATTKDYRLGEFTFPRGWFMIADAEELNTHKPLAVRFFGKDFALYRGRESGKVVLLDFWSAELGNSNTLNAELKEVYKKYADAPVAFEVYQVAIDTSKPLWISAVQEQQLPWVSVSDLRGRASSSLGLYNVQKLPANFLIDKEGNIVGKDIYGKSLEQKLDELTR